MAPQLLIATRLGLGIRDRDWFRHRLTLLSAITVPSLLAQRDQSFAWVLFVDSGLPDDIRKELERVLAPFDGRAELSDDGHNSASLLALARARDMFDADGYVITGRIDDDDAWNVRTVGMVRDRAAAWLRNRSDVACGLAMTFEEGLVWVMYEMVDVDHLQRRGRKVTRPAAVRRYAYPFTSISEFACSKVTGNAAALGIGRAAAAHSKVPELLADQGFDIDVIATDEPMWLYCRHKQATSSAQRAVGEEDLGMTVAEIAAGFGLDQAKVERYISSADEYGYAVVKRNFGLRGQLKDAIRETIARLRDPEVDAEERARLELERSRLQCELKQTADSVVGSLDEALERPHVSD